MEPVAEMIVIRAAQNAHHTKKRRLPNVGFSGSLGLVVVSDGNSGVRACFGFLRTS